jgi:CheY-like chemotaxis protein/phosphoribosyl 1,2-cyclic phosphodiesterase
MKFYVVDDDPDLLALLARLLLDAGHTVETCASSRRALADIPNVRPDCVVTDLMMPEMDGFELTRELRKRPELAAMKIIVLSAKTYDFDRRRAKELGADGYITKPIKRDTLLAQIGDMVTHKVVVTYWGVHGTLPVTGAGALRYGGNTPCVSVAVGGDEPLYVFDCGTGIKKLSDSVIASGAPRFSARIFISHPHWDHINTIPFFAPLYIRGNQIDVHGPYQGDLTMERVVSAQMESVYFPVTIREFGARLTFRDLREESLDYGAVQIDTMLLKHPGYCLGYKLRAHGSTVCYITDNELYLPGDPRYDVRYVETLADFVRGADVLITDTTYRDHEYPSKVDWGHSSVSQVADLAVRAQVKRLHLFHHDPDQDDEAIDEKTAETRAAIAKRGGEMLCESPAEGSTLVL